MKLLLGLFFAALAFGQSTRTVSLAWGHPSDTVTFNVYRATDACSAATLNWSKINTAAVAVKNYTDANLPYGVYCYRITAVAGTLESDPSNTAQADARPHPPTGLTLTLATAEIIVGEKGMLTARLDVRKE